MIQREPGDAAGAVGEIIAAPLGLLEHGGDAGEGDGRHHHGDDAGHDQVTGVGHGHVQHPKQEDRQQPGAGAEGVEEDPDGVGSHPANGIFQGRAGRTESALGRFIGHQGHGEVTA